MVVQLDDKLWFPDPHNGEPDGCIAVGGDLSADRLLLAYSNGIFPWYAFRYDDPVWFCPMQRFVIFPDEIHISHSMRTLMNKGKYRLSINEAFGSVINTCGKLRLHEEYAWLGPEMTEAYKELYRQGFAASVEVWEILEKPLLDGLVKEKFVGGLYGVTIGNTFFGESMCSLVPNASKLALIHLAKTMQQNGGKLIDCQFETAHLKSMGGRFIPYDEYMKIISS
ncbi:MAG: leucyl/phenylalanyl-tRNA--protein transferase [Prevotella sp.]|nr:leucyl/phenylalanyl-tRNA--protein transferase [Prevotella sp.]